VLREILAQRGPALEVQTRCAFDESPYAAARGVSGVEGWLGYWREHAGIADDVLARSPLDILHVAGDRAAARRILLDRLGLSLVEAPAPSGAALRRVVGTYRGGGAASRQCAVALGGAGLVLDGLLWPSDPLLPLPSGGFEIESWPFELDFEEDGTGAVCAMRVTGPPLGWGRVDGVYERL
jgi:hypothetical protein